MKTGQLTEKARIRRHVGIRHLEAAPAERQPVKPAPEVNPVAQPVQPVKIAGLNSVAETRPEGHDDLRKTVQLEQLASYVESDPLINSVVYLDNFGEASADNKRGGAVSVIGQVGISKTGGVYDGAGVLKVSANNVQYNHLEYTGDFSLNGDFCIEWSQRQDADTQHFMGSFSLCRGAQEMMTIQVAGNQHLSPYIVDGGNSPWGDTGYTAPGNWVQWCLDRKDGVIRLFKNGQKLAGDWNVVTALPIDRIVLPYRASNDGPSYSMSQVRITRASRHRATYALRTEPFQKPKLSPLGDKLISYVAPRRQIIKRLRLTEGPKTANGYTPDRRQEVELSDPVTGSSTVTITANGKTLLEWDLRAGLDQKDLYLRVEQGETVKAVFKTPPVLRNLISDETGLPVDFNIINTNFRHYLSFEGLELDKGAEPIGRAGYVVNP